MNLDCCVSPHEQRLLDKIEGKEDIYRASHPRVFKILETFDGLKPDTSNRITQRQVRKTDMATEWMK